MESELPDLPGRSRPERLELSALEALATSADVRDRAFAASVLRLRPDAEQPEIAAIYRRVRDTARAAHAEMRARLRDGALDAPKLLGLLERVAPEMRDHALEEMLDVAYPELSDVAPPRDVFCNTSGLTEILFMLEHARLGPGSTFVDLGSGVGKVTLLVALLTGARAHGIEIDPALVAHARAAASSLALDNADFVQGDIRDVPLPSADVYYLFVPFAGSQQPVRRLEPLAREHPLRLFSQALDVRHFSWLRATGAESYWLKMYVGGGG